MSEGKTKGFMEFILFCKFYYHNCGNFAHEKWVVTLFAAIQVKFNLLLLLLRLHFVESRKIIAENDAKGTSIDLHELLAPTFLRDKLILFLDNENNNNNNNISRLHHNGSSAASFRNNSSYRDQLGQLALSLLLEFQLAWLRAWSKSLHHNPTFESCLNKQRIRVTFRRLQSNRIAKVNHTEVATELIHKLDYRYHLDWLG